VLWYVAMSIPEGIPEAQPHTPPMPTIPVHNRESNPAFSRRPPHSTRSVPLASSPWRSDAQKPCFTHARKQACLLSDKGR